MKVGADTHIYSFNFTVDSFNRLTFFSSIIIWHIYYYKCQNSQTRWNKTKNRSRSETSEQHHIKNLEVKSLNRKQCDEKNNTYQVKVHVSVITEAEKLAMIFNEPLIFCVVLEICLKIVKADVWNHLLS